MLLNHPLTPTSHLGVGGGSGHLWQPGLCWIHGDWAGAAGKGLGSQGDTVGPHRDARSRGNLGLGLFVPEPYEAVHLTLGPPKTSPLLPHHRPGLGQLQDPAQVR